MWLFMTQSWLPLVMLLTELPVVRSQLEQPVKLMWLPRPLVPQLWRRRWWLAIEFDRP